MFTEGAILGPWLNFSDVLREQLSFDVFERFFSSACAFVSDWVPHRRTEDNLGDWQRCVTSYLKMWILEFLIFFQMDIVRWDDDLRILLLIFDS
jgi:hypothetical protein